jgi:hypothetical protein
VVRHPRGVPMSVEHIPCRPSWDCLVCGKAWPCDPAREALAVEYVGAELSLAMLLWLNFEDYVREADADPRDAEAYERFVGWSRSVRP